MVLWEELPAVLLGESATTTEIVGLATSGTPIAGVAATQAAAASALLETAGIVGGVTGAIATGTIKGALLGALEGIAFNQVGGLLQPTQATGSILASHTLVRVTLLKEWNG